MEPTLLSVATLIALIAIWSLSVRSRRAAARLEEIDTRRLKEVVEQSEQIKRACLVSLENMQRSLNALHSRIRSADPRFDGAFEGPRVEHKGIYEAAALLLEAGQSPERVARMIDLPVDQVALVQELRRILAKDPAAQKSAERGEEVARRGKPRREKPARAERETVRPILLTDVVSFDPALDGRNSHGPGDRGAAA